MLGVGNFGRSDTSAGTFNMPSSNSCRSTEKSGNFFQRMIKTANINRMMRKEKKKKLSTHAPATKELRSKVWALNSLLFFFSLRGMNFHTFIHIFEIGCLLAFG